jgi:microcystin-dependent protein
MKSYYDIFGNFVPAKDEKVKQIEKFADVSSDDIKKAVKDVYQADVEAIRNLSNVATKLQKEGLTMPGKLTVQGGANIDGRLYFRNSNASNNAWGPDDSDPYYIEKVRSSQNNNHLRLTINDDFDESFQIWGNSCGAGDCGGEGKQLFKFGANGNLDIAGGFNLLPRGIIVAYNGETAPAGWALCDGTNGTPDLRGRFIRMWNDKDFKQDHGWHGGATNSQVKIQGVNETDTLRGGARGLTHGYMFKHRMNDIGGSDVWTLDVKEMPIHSHGMNTSGNHKHPIYGTGVDQLGYANGGNGRFAATDRNNWNFDNNNFGGLGTAGNHTHDIHNAGSSWGHGITNPYYVLSYIMKL